MKREKNVRIEFKVKPKLAKEFNKLVNACKKNNPRLNRSTVFAAILIDFLDFFRPVTNTKTLSKNESKKKSKKAARCGKDICKRGEEKAIKKVGKARRSSRKATRRVRG